MTDAGRGAGGGAGNGGTERTEEAAAGPARLSRAEVVRLMELLFFAYRDFVSDPDAILAGLGFGRAHHRVIHFVGRHPGLRVSELLDILRITKQSLGRVLRELIDRGYVYQRAGRTDRRQRLLYLTEAGRRLHAQLAAPQIARVRRALEESGPEAAETLAAVLLAMVDPAARPGVRSLVESGRALREAGAGGDDGDGGADAAADAGGGRRRREQ